MKGQRMRTVLVLGAGASNSYGFPLGRGLRDLVCTLCMSTHPRKVVVEQGFSDKEVEDFGHALSRSGYTSVDWFVEKYPEYREIAKPAIAAVMIPFEDESQLFSPHAPDDHWYEDLFNRLWSEDTNELRGGNRAGEEELIILTFNYDRSLEHYFITAYNQRCKLESDSSVIETWGEGMGFSIGRGPTILHLHGDLGALIGDDGQQERPYTTEVSPETVRTAASGLTLLSEADGDSSAFASARDEIERCDRLVFLGFGFLLASVQRLANFHDDSLEGTEVTGTQRGFSPSRWASVQEEALGGQWSGGGGTVANFLKDFDLLPAAQ